MFAGVLVGVALLALTSTLTTTVVDALWMREDGNLGNNNNNKDEVEFAEQYFDQKLNHFDQNDTRTFQQRYFVNDLYFNDPNGPIFLYMSGEAPLYGPPKKHSHIDLLAQRHHALLIALEHRYYGQSIPFDKLTVHHLKFLNTRQALLDTAAFVMFYQSKLNQFKESARTNFRNNNNNNAFNEQIEERFENVKANKWVTFGGSYAGALAAWMRVKFPDLISSAIVSSAIVNVQTEFYNFDSAIAHTVGSECALVMRRTSDTIDALLANNEEDNALVKNLFKATMLEDGDFRFMLVDAMSMAVQYGYKDKVCEPLVEASSRGGMALVHALVGYVNEFFYPTLDVDGPAEYSIEYLQNEDTDEDKSGRQWWYQKCSELGLFQVAPPRFSVRSPLVNIEYHRTVCKRVFEGEDLWPDKDAVRSYYGGDKPQGTRIFFANGGDDPWRLASVTSSSNTAALPAEVAQCIGCGHCVDMKEPHQTDPSQLIELRDDIERYLAAWLE